MAYDGKMLKELKMEDGLFEDISAVKYNIEIYKEKIEEHKNTIIELERLIEIHEKNKKKK